MNINSLPPQFSRIPQFGTIITFNKKPVETLHGKVNGATGTGRHKDIGNYKFKLTNDGEVGINVSVEYKNTSLLIHQPSSGKAYIVGGGAEQNDPLSKALLEEAALIRKRYKS